MSTVKPQPQEAGVNRADGMGWGTVREMNAKRNKKKLVFIANICLYPCYFIIFFSSTDEPLKNQVITLNSTEIFRCKG